MISFLRAVLFGKERKVSFSQAIDATHWLLVTTGVHSWAKRFSEFRSGNTAGFTSIHGGMGSFSDLIICRANNHQIEEKREPLANQLLQHLSSICYATFQRGDLTANEALEACGTMGCELQGWRCRDCGYSCISPQDLNAFAAYEDVEQSIRSGIEKGAFGESLQNVWAGFNSDHNESRFRPDAESSGISFATISGWMRPCPKCGSNDTCVYRWDFGKQGFTSSKDNLSMKRR